MNTKYNVSVVTPFFNVDKSMFAKCVEGMRAQTIGFDTIQWIIVLHNCEDSYKQDLQVLFRDDANVELKVLDNDVRNPSSPRNYGMQFVTAPYVGFLDSDDSYLPDCLEVALREVKETNSDMVVFRRENEMENETVDGSLLLTTMLWNNIKKRVIIEHGDRDDVKMFTGPFGFVTNNLFRMDFLRREGLTFCEDMYFGEDIMFMVQSLCRADRICYLMHHIGYHYFVNSSSMVQKGCKSPEMLIKYAKGFRLLLDTMRSYGIDTQEYTQALGSVVAGFILQTPTLTFEHRQEIKDILGDDILSTHLIPSGKHDNPEMRRMVLFMARDVILNPEHPGAEYLKNTTNGIAELSKILYDNRDTDMGRNYHFGNLDIRSYRNRLPLTNKDSYRPLIALQTRVGEHHIITAHPIVRYLESRNGELTPVTEPQAQKYAECLAATLRGKKNILLARSYPVLARTNDGAVVDTLNSSIVKDYFCRNHLKDGLPQAMLTSPVERYFATSSHSDPYFKLLRDALSEDAEQLVAFTAGDMYDAMQSLERDWRSMVEQMPEGKRKDEVTRILEQGFDTPIVPRLWPSLQRVVCFGAGKMREPMEKLRRYIGLLPHNHGYDYLKSAVMGKAVGDDNELFECIRGHCFYEFIPVDGDAQRTLMWSELEIGKAYKVVVTNHAGFYRYCTGHIISPQEITPQTIRFMIYPNNL